MAKTAEPVNDKSLLKQIRVFLQAGVMEWLVSPDEGTPQAGPLSPQVSSIVVDEFDRERERRKLRFAQYADGSYFQGGRWRRRHHSKPGPRRRPNPAAARV